MVIFTGTLEFRYLIIKIMVMIRPMIKMMMTILQTTQLKARQPVTPFPSLPSFFVESLVRPISSFLPFFPILSILPTLRIFTDFPRPFLLQSLHILLSSTSFLWPSPTVRRRSLLPPISFSFSKQRHSLDTFNAHSIVVINMSFAMYL